MPEVTGRIPVDAIMKMLEISDLPTACRFTPKQKIELDCVTVSQYEIDNLSTEPEVQYEFVDPNIVDLREGLEALRTGDIAMARILLDRAFDGNSDETRAAVEAALQPSSVRAAA